MALEIEVKYLDADHAGLRQRLESLAATCAGRWLESNTVFDDARRSLKASGTLLRLREEPRRFVLTLKRAASGTVSTHAKVYEESETDISDPASLNAILAGLGLTPALRYEKFRETWSLLGCEVCLDTLPFGHFVEIEGSEMDIAACAKALGLPQDKASTATYHDLNRQSRAALGLAPIESFVFDAAVKARLLSGCATGQNGLPPLDRRPPNA